MLYLQRRWMQSPPGPRQIDWANPLTLGLALFAYPIDGGPLADIVDPKRISGLPLHGSRVTGRTVGGATISATLTSDLNFTTQSVSYGASFFITQSGVSSTILDRGFWDYAQGNGGYALFTRSDGRLHLKHHDNNADSDGGNSLYETISPPFPTSYGVSFDYSAGWTGRISVFRNGRFYRSDSSFSRPHSAVASDLRLGGPATPTSCAWLFNRAISPDALAALTENPYQILQPARGRLIYPAAVPSGMSNGTATATGMAAAAAVGPVSAVVDVVATSTGTGCIVDAGSARGAVSAAAALGGVPAIVTGGTASASLDGPSLAVGSASVGEVGSVLTRTGALWFASSSAMTAAAGTCLIRRSGWIARALAEPGWIAAATPDGDWVRSASAAQAWPPAVSPTADGDPNEGEGTS